PAVVAQVDLGPRVGVAAGDVVVAVVAFRARREPDGDASRDADSPSHRGVGAGELFAETDLLPQEVDHGEVAVTDRGLERIGEVVAEEVLERERLVVDRALALGAVRRLLTHFAG